MNSCLYTCTCMRIRWNRKLQLDTPTVGHVVLEKLLAILSSPSSCSEAKQRHRSAAKTTKTMGTYYMYVQTVHDVSLWSVQGTSDFSLWSQWGHSYICRHQCTLYVTGSTVACRESFIQLMLAEQENHRGFKTCICYTIFAAIETLVVAMQSHNLPYSSRHSKVQIASLIGYCITSTVYCLHWVALLNNVLKLYIYIIVSVYTAVMHL